MDLNVGELKEKISASNAFAVITAAASKLEPIKKLVTKQTNALNRSVIIRILYRFPESAIAPPTILNNTFIIVCEL